MTFRISYKKDNYKSDYKNYLLYNKKRDIFILGSCISITFFLFLLKLIIPNNEVVLSLLTGMVIFSIIMFAFEAYQILMILDHINKSSQKLYEGFETITFKSTSIDISHRTKVFPIFLSQVKECIILKDTLFVIFKNKKEWPIRINKSEMEIVGFNEILKEFKSRQICVINTK